jgi:predicted DNA-binding transcriptional regulator AlpA
MQLVSIPELAEILKLSAATVRCRIKNGEWPRSVSEKSGLKPR